ncbi:MAG: hypothetical protein KGL39_31250 [Patescibacteria group bacterium]|nr:hypothetical protein [Patescibacteria group bacterium]
MKFEKINLNPSGRKAPDCVIRAIMKATHKSWLETFDGLNAVARSQFTIGGDKRAYEIYLAAHGFVKQPMPRFADRTRYTVKEFADANPTGVFVIGIANHLTVIVDGTLFDTWDCSRKSVGNFWEKL